MSETDTYPVIPQIPLDYVAICPECKAMVAWHSGNPERSNDVAREIGNLIRDGLDIQQMTTLAAQLYKPWGHSDTCTMKPKRKAKK